MTSSSKAKHLRILSWNLLHRKGALIDDISRLVDEHKPELFLMQEATEAIDTLNSILGGHYYRHPWSTRRHGLAAWSSSPISLIEPLSLPYSKVPGSFPPRIAQLIKINQITIANVHLSHGQVLNRRQLSEIAGSTTGPTAIIGDYNAVGPINLKKFSDVGPKGTTHMAQRMIPFRLDRCMIRELDCAKAKKLDQGKSDHKPILVDLEVPVDQPC